MYEKPIATVMLNGELVKAFPLKAGLRLGCPLSPLLINVVLELIAKPVRKSDTNRKE
jgi:hypothetical protein